jgi:hypothetical protein
LPYQSFSERQIQKMMMMMMCTTSRMLLFSWNFFSSNYCHSWILLILCLLQPVLMVFRFFGVRAFFRWTRRPLAERMEAQTIKHRRYSLALRLRKSIEGLVTNFINIHRLTDYII